MGLFEPLNTSSIPPQFFRGSMRLCRSRGGGKTIIACEVARRYALPVGVVCPKSVKAKWQATLEAFGITPVFVENPEKLRAGNTPWIKKVGKNFKWVPESLLLIVDEVHMCAGMKSQNGQMLEDAPYRVLMLSATAAESPLRMKSIGAKLGLFHPRQFWGWARKMGAQNGQWGGLEWDPKTADELASFFEVSCRDARCRRVSGR